MSFDKCCRKQDCSWLVETGDVEIFGDQHDLGVCLSLVAAAVWHSKLVASFIEKDIPRVPSHVTKYTLSLVMNSIQIEMRQNTCSLQI